MLRTPRGHVVVSTDLLVEGRHFRRDWVGAHDLGRKAAAANLSDVNAMGGTAHSLTVGLAAPADLPAQWALDLADGIAEEAALVGASIVGGDLTTADQVVVAITVLGTCDVARRAAHRSAARRRARAGRPAGLGGRGAGRARPRVPLAARAGRGLPAPPAAVRRRTRRGARRRHLDDRRLRRAAGRRRPPRVRLRGRHRRDARLDRARRPDARGRLGARRRPDAVRARRG